MMGSPPLLPPPLPPPPPLPSSYGSSSVASSSSSVAMALDEEQPHRGEDYDLLSGWARALSVSPRLYPTYGSGSGGTSGMGMGMGMMMGMGMDGSGGAGGGGMSATFGSYRGLGDASPQFGPRKEFLLTVGTGLSPLLGPTHLSHGHGHGVGSGATNGGSGAMLMASGQGAYDYPSGGFGSPASSHALAKRSSQQSNGAGPSPAHSFSNVEKLRSMSPQDLPPPMHPRSPLATPYQPLPSTSTSTPLVPVSSAHLDAISETLAPDAPARRMSGTGTSEAATDEDPRIRAYAKLEFPTFDIYIQKLSVIVGRRPAAVAAPSLNANPNGSAGGMELRAGSQEGGLLEAQGVEVESDRAVVKLEDFVFGIGEDNPGGAARVGEAIKQEDVISLPIITRTPSSPPASLSPKDDGLNDDGHTNFAEFLKSSPPSLPALLPIEAEPESKAPAPIPRPMLAATPSTEFQTSSSSASASAAALNAETAALLNELSLAAAQSHPMEQDAPPPSAPEQSPEEQQQKQEFSPPRPTLAVAAPAPASTLTDIDLGPIRAVSRQHARLYFDYEMGGWAIEVLGRNGVVVEGKWKAKGEREALGKRTKIQIAERIFHFVLPTIDPVAGPAVASTTAGSMTGRSPALLEAPLSDDDDDERDQGDDSDDSSSLSEVSDSDIELSPMLQPVRALPPASASAEASTSSLLALAPPPRLASKGASYGASAGKRLEVLQAVRSGGKGKGAGKGKGKGKAASKAKKGKTTLPAKRVRRPSNAMSYDDSDSDGEEDDRYYLDEFDSEDDEDERMGSMSPPKRLPTEPVKKRKEELVKKIVIKQQRQEALKQPQKQPQKQPKKHPKKKVAVARAAPSQPVASALPPPPPPSSAVLQDPSLPPLPPIPSHGPSDSPHVVPAPAFPPVLEHVDTKPDLAGPNSHDIPVAPPLATSTPSPYDLPPPVSGASPVASTSALPRAPVPGAIAGPPGVPGQPLVPGAPPIKRGRGRPPKNGICAQRPRKPKPEGGDPANAGVKLPKLPKAPKALKMPKVSIQVNGLPIDPTLTDDTPPAVTTTTSHHVVQKPRAQPMPLVTGEPPPLAAPVDDRFTKPPYTYASLIAQAVSSTELKKLTLNGIYDWITARWPYFSDNQNGWQNSIRHNLTISRGFLKVPRREDEPGKGAFWMVDPDQVSNFDGLHFRKKNLKPSMPGMPKAPTQPRPPAQPKPKAALVPKPPPKPTPPSGVPTLSTPLPIIVAPIPDSYVRPAPPPASAGPPDDLTAALLKDPPIVLHEGKLILNPSIFAHLTKDQLDNLQVLAASQALQILQAYVVQHFKEKMRKMATDKAAAAAAAAAGGGSVASSASPVTAATGVGSTSDASTTGVTPPPPAVAPTSGLAAATASSTPAAAPPKVDQQSTTNTLPQSTGVRAPAAPMPSETITIPPPVSSAVVRAAGLAEGPVATKRKANDEPDIEVSAPAAKMLKREVEVLVID